MLAYARVKSPEHFAAREVLPGKALDDDDLFVILLPKLIRQEQFEVFNALALLLGLEANLQVGDNVERV